MTTLHELERTLAEMISLQQEKIMGVAQQVAPGCTEDDLLQPNDFPQLETHPVFRYEEGILSGLLSVRMAMRALEQERR